MSETVEVLGLSIPNRERVTVEEREALELFALEAAQKNLSNSRQKYGALRILARLRLDKELPEWRSDAFDKQYRPYFDDDYVLVEIAADDLLAPFSQELERKKSLKMAAAYEASGSESELKALIQAAEATLNVFRAALKRLEKTGPAPN